MAIGFVLLRFILLRHPKGNWRSNAELFTVAIYITVTDTTYIKSAEIKTWQHVSATTSRH
jgi:hypothetical protein